MLVTISNAITTVFQYCAEYFMDFVTGIIPMVLIMMTLFNAIIAALGQKRIEKITKFMARNKFLAYTILPILSWLLLSNPMLFTTAKFLPPRQRAGFYEAVNCTGVPLMCFFPHVNPAELYAFLGIAGGVEALGYSVEAMGIRYLCAAVVVALVRGLVAERFWLMFAKREGRQDLIEADVVHN